MANAGPSRSADREGSIGSAPSSSGPPAAHEVPVRPAATLMVVRDGHDGSSPLEVLMVRRSLRSEFIGGVYVFPGGAVEESDGGPEAHRLCPDLSDERASAVLGVERGGLAFWVAALRECFEEAGLLLARHAVHGNTLSFADPVRASAFAAHRHALNVGRRGFVAICEAEGLELPAADVRYFSHWVTPVGGPRRFDTRFFVATAPPDQTPAHDAGETIGTVWVRPDDALERHRAGEIDLIFPTIRSLQAIGRFTRAGDLLSAAAGSTGVRPPVLVPRMVADGRGVRVLLPGDDGYDDPGAAAGLPVGLSYDEATRLISRAANPGPGSPSAS